MSWIETIETVTVPEHACFQETPGDVYYASARDWLYARRSIAFRDAGARSDHACFQAVPTCVPCLSGVPADDEPETPEEAGAVAAARGGRAMTTAELRRRLSVGERLYGYGVEWLNREHAPARWERVCRRWASKHKAH